MKAKLYDTYEDIILNYFRDTDLAEYYDKAWEQGMLKQTLKQVYREYLAVIATGQPVNMLNCYVGIKDEMENGFDPIVYNRYFDIPYCLVLSAMVQQMRLESSVVRHEKYVKNYLEQYDEILQEIFKQALKDFNRVLNMLPRGVTHIKVEPNHVWFGQYEHTFFTADGGIQGIPLKENYYFLNYVIINRMFKRWHAMFCPRTFKLINHPQRNTYVIEVKLDISLPPFSHRTGW